LCVGGNNKKGRSLLCTQERLNPELANILFAAARYCSSVYQQINILYRLSEAGNEKYCYELHARSGLRFAMRLQEDS
jgi:hypothetical protein